LDNGERDTGGHNEGVASNHPGGNNQDQGRQLQGQEVQGNGGHERRGLQNETQNKRQKLRIMTLAAEIISVESSERERNVCVALLKRRSLCRRLVS